MSNSTFPAGKTPDGEVAAAGIALRAAVAAELDDAIRLRLFVGTTSGGDASGGVSGLENAHGRLSGQANAGEHFSGQANTASPVILHHPRFLPDDDTVGQVAEAMLAGYLAALLI